MDFLNPIFLWAAFAVAIPIIVHLFNFRRPRKVLFSNLALVKEVKKSVVRRLKLKQWIVLLTRILAILALVFMFANPILRSEETGNVVVGNTSVALVIDDSYSMKAGNEKGAYFQQARRLGEEIIKAHSRQDEFLLLKASDLILNSGFADQEDAGEALKDLRIRQNSLSLGELLKLSPDLFRKAANQRHHLYLLSDFQKSTLLNDSTVEIPSDSGLFLNLYPLATRPQTNIYIADHEIATRIIEPGKPVTLKLFLVNDGEEAVKELGIRVMVEGKAIAISNESIEGGEKKEVEISFSPPGTGWRSGYIEIDDYPIEFDNRRYFTFYIPEKEKVLVVEGEGSRSVRLMFQDLLTQFEAEVISFRDFSTARIEDYKFVVLVGMNEISTGQQEQLSQHLKEGKSIMFFPGGDMQKTSINRFLSALQIGEFGDLQTSETGFSASNADLDHPVFGDIFRKDARKGRFDAPDVFRYYPFQPDNAVQQNAIISMGQGDPFLLETRPENGLFFLFSSLPKDDWTNFQYKGIFAPLMLRLSLLMNQTQNLRQSQDLGNFSLKKIKTREKDLIKLKDEEGGMTIPEQYAQGGFVVLKFDKLDLKEGNYELVQNEKLLEKISFNIPDQESQLGAPDRSDLESYVEELGLPRVRIADPSPDAVADDIRFAKEGLPLWKYFLIAALIFLLIEILLLRLKESY